MSELCWWVTLLTVAQCAQARHEFQGRTASLFAEWRPQSCSSAGRDLVRTVMPSNILFFGACAIKGFQKYMRSDWLDVWAAGVIFAMWTPNYSSYITMATWLTVGVMIVCSSWSYPPASRPIRCRNAGTVEYEHAHNFRHACRIVSI
jgi:hypothetical protein